jgi:hypothetical protein
MGQKSQVLEKLEYRRGMEAGVLKKKQQQQETAQGPLSVHGVVMKFPE